MKAKTCPKVHLSAKRWGWPLKMDAAVINGLSGAKQLTHYHLRRSQEFVANVKGKKKDLSGRKSQQNYQIIIIIKN